LFSTGWFQEQIQA